MFLVGAVGIYDKVGGFTVDVFYDYCSFFTFSPISLSTAELPMLYLGIYTFILLAGPGRYSADKFLREDFSFRNLVRKHGRSLILKDRYHRNRN